MAYLKTSDITLIRISNVKWQQEINLHQEKKKMTDGMNFKIGCCEIIFVHFSCLIYNVNITVEMPNL